MGLPESIKNILASPGEDNAKSKAVKPSAKNTSSRALAKSSKHPGSSQGLRRPRARPGAPGLPEFKQPPLPKGHRAILVACSSTHRASWAVLKQANGPGDGPAGTYTFQSNITAVPEAAKASKESKESSPAARNGRDKEPELEIEKLDLTGFACGICGAGGAGSPHDTDIVRCNNCRTIQCMPASVYDCPGCGVTMNAAKMGTLDSLELSEVSKGSGGPEQVRCNQDSGTALGGDGQPRSIGR